ncbi:hypothetical protein AGLY_002756 [Aphis glycines]|uniref:Uncharacterized protein n=1 Tax=Aphis glycines TaxID=307491 RepID=A0A6G0U172_APHGL|nr:hypothetical protein AGLY_002756 [Aphis glycines]
MYSYFLPPSHRAQSSKLFTTSYRYLLLSLYIIVQYTIYIYIELVRFKQLKLNNQQVEFTHTFPLSVLICNNSNFQNEPIYQEGKKYGVTAALIVLHFCYGLCAFLQIKTSLHYFIVQRQRLISTALDRVPRVSVKQAKAALTFLRKFTGHSNDVNNDKVYYFTLNEVENRDSRNRYNYTANLLCKDFLLFFFPTSFMAIISAGKTKLIVEKCEKSGTLSNCSYNMSYSISIASTGHTASQYHSGSQHNYLIAIRVYNYPEPGHFAATDLSIMKNLFISSVVTFCPLPRRRLKSESRLLHFSATTSLSFADNDQYFLDVDYLPIVSID